jgi:hypothetical protein
MKYETPQMTALTSAINAIQSTSSKSIEAKYPDTYDPTDLVPEVIMGTYTDWE